MGETYSPRTVALVALASLVLGFVLVFGGGMLALRPRAPSAVEAPPEPVIPPPPPRRAVVDSGAAADEPAAERDGTAAGDPVLASGDPGDAGAPQGPAPEPVTVAGITIGPASPSRCYDRGNPAVIPGARCDRLPGLDRHVVAHATQIAQCARSGAHGRLMMLLDFRFSTGFMNGWGTPTSNIPNAGTVAACVKTRITPLPFASIEHQHDRYIVAIPIDW